MVLAVLLVSHGMASALKRVVFTEARAHVTRVTMGRICSKDAIMNVFCLFSSSLSLNEKARNKTFVFSDIPENFKPDRKKIP